MTAVRIEQGAAVRPSAHTVLVIAAVMLAGLLAAVEVSSLLTVPTLLVAWLLAREARRMGLSPPPSLEFSELPAELRATVERTMTQLPEGDARRLLSQSLAQARPLLALHQGTLDAEQENATRNNVLSLVDACCYTALELARLDAASGARAPGAGSDSAIQTAAARELLVGRLSSATTALASLFVAGVMHGFPASDRVAELAQEINADASARQAAAAEISALLGDSVQPPPPRQPEA
jgi:hypothetical protein